MRPPDNDRVPAQGARRDSTSSVPQGQLDQDLDLALQRNPQVGHVTGIDGWPQLAAWLKAGTP